MLCFTCSESVRDCLERRREEADDGGQRGIWQRGTYLYKHRQPFAGPLFPERTAFVHHAFYLLRRHNSTIRRVAKAAQEAFRCSTGRSPATWRSRPDTLVQCKECSSWLASVLAQTSSDRYNQTIRHLSWGRHPHLVISSLPMLSQALPCLPEKCLGLSSVKHACKGEICCLSFECRRRSLLHCGVQLNSRRLVKMCACGCVDAWMMHFP